MLLQKSWLLPCAWLFSCASAFRPPCSLSPLHLRPNAASRPLSPTCCNHVRRGLTPYRRLKLEREAEVAPGGKEDTQQAGDVSYAAMLRFVLPTLGIWLAGPIMSLIDTGCVGTRSSVELAALGPATTLTDSLLYSCAFIGVATTNLLATALAEGNEEEGQKVVAHALSIALSMGFVIALVVWGVGEPLLTIFSAGKTPAIIPPAFRYARRRILGGPACLATMVMQSACLASKDSFSPLLVVLAAALLNGIGDYFSVCRWGQGIGGAATATALAEVLSSSLLTYVVLKKQGKRLYPFLKLPPLPDLKKFAEFAGPIFLALLGKIVCYTYITYVVTMAGQVPLAAHNVMLRIFFFFTTFGDSLSQAGQAFLPGLLATDPPSSLRPRLFSRKKEGRPLSDTMIRKIVVLGGMIGGLNAAFAGLLPLRLPHLFTSDAAITKAMHEITPLLSWALLSHACVMGLEGILLAKRQLSYLARIYALDTCLLVGYLYSVNRWTQLGGLHTGWWGLFLLQSVRFVQFTFRLRRVRKKERAAAMA
ncbi:unnamed protein product [Chrysoparadoxa australica]